MLPIITPAYTKSQLSLDLTSLNIKESGFKGPFGGLAPASRRSALCGVIKSNGTDPSTSTRILHVAPSYSVSDIRVLFDNIVYNNGSSEVLAPNAITISAALEYPLGVITPLSFGGQSTTTIQKHGTVLSDSLPIDLPAGANYWVLSYITQTGSTFWPTKTLTMYAAGGGAGGQFGDSLGTVLWTATNATPIVCSVYQGTHNLTTGQTVKIAGATGNTAANGTWVVTVIDTTTFSLNTSIGNGTYTGASGTIIGIDSTKPGSAKMQGSGGVQAYSPTAVFYSPARGINNVFVSIIGDSIANGSGDSGSGSGGWIMRGLGSTAAQNLTTIPALNVSLPGTTASQFAGTAVSIHDQSLRRRLWCMSSPYTFINFGTNDIYGSSRTVAQLQADNLSIATSAQRRNSRVYISTLLPRTTSTNSWATATGQTVLAQESLRITYNTWLRAGAPIISGVAVAPGTNGALLAGSSGHPFFGVLDPASLIEVNSSNVLTVNGGFWLTNGTANYPTVDGTHPSIPASVILSAAVPFSSLISF